MNAKKLRKIALYLQYLAVVLEGEAMDRKEKWTCWEIENAGEGERGKKVVDGDPAVISRTPAQAAERAAMILDESRLDVTDEKMSETFIEVETEAGPQRFVVVSRLSLQYRAHPAPEKGSQA